MGQAGAHVLARLVPAELALDENDASAALGYAERYLRRLGSGQPIESAAALEPLVPIRIKLDELPAARDAHAQSRGWASHHGPQPSPWPPNATCSAEAHPLKMR